MNEFLDRLIAFKKDLGALTDQELVERFNREVEIGSRTWGSARSTYLIAIRLEFEKRSIDYSAIGDSSSLSFKHPVQLKDKKIVIG